MDTDSDIGIDAQEEENYFISITDLMTGVVFIFVLLLVTYALTFRAAQTALRTEHVKATEDAKRFQQDIAKTKGDLAREEGENRAKAERIDALAKVLKQREEQRKRILEDLVTRLNTRGVAVSLDSDNGIIRLPEELLFDSAQATLRPAGAQGLDVLAEELCRVLRTWCSPQEDFRLEAMFIEGHTDSHPIKTPRFADNWELSTARAVSISHAMTQAQPELTTFRNPKEMPVLGVSGYGENRPVAENSTDEGRRKNRRIDIRFIIAYPSDEQIKGTINGLHVQ